MIQKFDPLKYTAEFILLFLAVYLFLAFLAPVAYKFGQPELGRKIHSAYRIFCHQRVERSIFLFGEEGLVKTYQLEHLHELEAIPESNPNLPEPLSDTVFGYPYLGNEQIGYKVALCVRDLGLYTALFITGLCYLFAVKKSGKVKKYNWRVIALLMIPMAADGLFQVVSQLLGWDWVPEVYYENNVKRVVTGALFGIGFGFAIFATLKDAAVMMYNEPNEKDADK